MEGLPLVGRKVAAVTLEAAVEILAVEDQEDTAPAPVEAAEAVALEGLEDRVAVSEVAALEVGASTTGASTTRSGPLMIGTTSRTRTSPSG